MANVKSLRGDGLRAAALSAGIALLAHSAAGVQTPQKVPVTHERQCVATGEIAPGDARTITVTWKQPFATGAYDVIGSVSAGDDLQAIELAHVVVPNTPASAAAVVVNRNASAAQSGLLCLDATAE